jgi:ABC-2 type transport system permease protein
MKSKWWRIAQRECAVRMNKPAFWILSLMGPLVLMILSVVPYAVSSNLEEQKTVLINAPQTLSSHFPLTIGAYQVLLLDTSAQEAVGLFLLGTPQVLADLHVGEDTLWTIYSKGALHPADSLTILRTLQGIRPSVSSITSRVVNIEQHTGDELSVSPLQQTLALLATILVYFFLFTYSVSLLKGVMEEKSNKVMDLILSSISPAVWIIGKIAGVGLASFVQFLLGIGISYIPFYFFKQKYGGALQPFSAENIHASLVHTQQADIGQAMGWYDWLLMMESVHWFTLFVTMVVTMIFGFVLYAGVFAIIGMMAGRESDAQPYVLPVTSPLIFSFVASGAVIADPHGDMAQWLSVIPFTAPVVLTLRAGLGVVFSDLWISLLSLAVMSILVVASAGKVYKRMLNNGGFLFRFGK